MYLTSSILQKHFGECNFHVVVVEDVIFLTRNHANHLVIKDATSDFKRRYMADFIFLLIPNAITVQKNRASGYRPTISLSDPEFFTKLDAVFGRFLLQVSE